MRLHCGFIKSEYLGVGSGKYFSAANQPSIIIILKILVYGVIVCCVCFDCLFWAFFIDRLCGLFVVIDFTIDWWDSLSCLFFMFWVNYWLRDFGLFFLIVWYDWFSGWLFFVERLWFCEKEEKLWSVGALQRCFC